MKYAYDHLRGLPTAMFHFFTVYGTWRWPDLALYKFVAAILNDRKIDIYSHGGVYQDSTYVTDLVRAIRLQIDAVPERPLSSNEVSRCDTLSSMASFRIANIGNSDTVRLSEPLTKLKSVSKRKRSTITWKCSRLMCLSRGLLHICLGFLTGYRPQTSFKDGIARFVA